MKEMIIEVRNEAEMKAFGSRLAAFLAGGDILELVGDVGAGKTTLTKGIAAGLGVDDDVQSPSFTINRVYDTLSGLRLSHYDFYRLSGAGIMADELQETLHDPEAITIIEWAELVTGVLPADRVTIAITATGEASRRLSITAGGPKSKRVVRRLA